MPARLAPRVSTRAASEAASRLRYSSKDPRRARMLHHHRNNNSSSSNHHHRKPSITKDLLIHISMKRATRIRRCHRLLWRCTRRNNNIPAVNIPFLLRPSRSTITNRSRSNSNSNNTARRRSTHSSRLANRATHTTRIPCHPLLQAPPTAARTPIRHSTRSPALLSVHPCSLTSVSLRLSNPSISAPRPVLRTLCSTRSACPRTLPRTLCHRNLHIPPSLRNPMERGRPSTIPQTSRSATEASVLVPRQGLCSPRARIVPIRRGPLGRGIHHTNPVRLSVVRSTRLFHLSLPPNSLPRSVLRSLASAARRPELSEIS
jgi:hypothetical protein